jgi:hypothetical protein
MNDNDWLLAGQGERPHQSWSFSTEAPLVGLRLARETADLLAADAAGGFYQLDRQGRLARVTHGPSPIRSIGWSDTGNGGIAQVGDDKLYWFNPQLTFQGCLEHADALLSIALESQGQYAAVSLADASLVIYDRYRKRVRQFRTVQPYIAMEFQLARPELVGLGEHGALYAHQFTGQQAWHAPMWSAVGDMAIAGDGQTILLACYAHGIQCHDEHGAQLGTYQVGGTVSRVATGFDGRAIAAATVERHFYFMDHDGNVIWQAILPDDLCRLCCDPCGDGVILGFQSGRITRLDW